MDETKQHRRISIPAAIAIAAVSGAVAAATSWGAQGQRVTQLEDSVRELRQADRERDKQAAAIMTQLATINAQNQEALRRLERMERKLFEESKR